MPGYDLAQRLAREAPAAVKGGALAATWSDTSDAFEYTKDGQGYRCAVTSGTITTLGPVDEDRMMEFFIDALRP